MLGLLGGTFDPVHLGHLRLAEELAEALALRELRLIPVGTPPHRGAPLASAQARLEMTRLAVANHPVLTVDSCEVLRTGPSFTVNTLKAIRAQQAGVPVCLLMGADAFAGLASWHSWRELPALAHIVVASRSGHAAGRAPTAVAELWPDGPVRHPDALRDRPHGLLLEVGITGLDVSASRVRELLRLGRSVRYLLPDAVLEYILRHGLYGGIALPQSGRL